MAAKKTAAAVNPKVGKSGFSDITVTKKGSKKSVEVKADSKAASRIRGASDKAIRAKKTEDRNAKTYLEHGGSTDRRGRTTGRVETAEPGYNKEEAIKLLGSMKDVDERDTSYADVNRAKAVRETKDMARIPTADSDQQARFDLASAINTLKPNSVNKSRANVHIYGAEAGDQKRTHIAALGGEHHTGCTTKGCNNLVPTAFGDSVCPTCSLKDDAKFESWAKRLGAKGASATKLYTPEEEKPADKN